MAASRAHAYELGLHQLARVFSPGDRVTDPPVDDGARARLKAALEAAPAVQAAGVSRLTATYLPDGSAAVFAAAPAAEGAPGDASSRTGVAAAATEEGGDASAGAGAGAGGAGGAAGGGGGGGGDSMPPPKATATKRVHYAGSRMGGTRTVVTGQGTRRKVPLGPGYSQMDWMRLQRSMMNSRPGGGGGFPGGPLGLRPITLSEVAKHNSREDAWMAVRGKVYDVTKYFDFHPGGPAQLRRGVGKDGTALFDEKHAFVNIDAMMRGCCIGVLVPDDGSSSSSAAATGAAQASPSPPTSSSDEDEEDVE